MTGWRLGTLLAAPRLPKPLPACKARPVQRYDLAQYGALAAMQTGMLQVMQLLMFEVFDRRRLRLEPSRD